MITFVLAVCGNVDYIYTFPLSPPSRAAWIEINSSGMSFPNKWSPPSRAAWIEIFLIYFSEPIVMSPPSRAAWIEIDYINIRRIDCGVAAFTGGVD